VCVCVRACARARARAPSQCHAATEVMYEDVVDYRGNLLAQKILIWSDKRDFVTSEDIVRL
jgi:hypothetical protein